jgi:hypothetical protein
MQRLCLSFLLFSAACYSPDLSGVRYTCDPTNPICPDGLYCVRGYCELSPDGSGSGDGGTSSSTGCASGQGTKVGAAWACAGVFNTNANDMIPVASALCAKGFSLCKDATGIDLTACRSLPGFFAADVVMKRNYWDRFSGAVCGGPGNMQVRLYAGCGRSNTNYIGEANQLCSGFNQVLDCYSAGQANQWSCTNASNLDNVSQTTNTDGVLCCPG